MKKAFTLVELLIVIIIIGILATAAIPQYQKMISRARWGQAFMILDALRRSELLYYAEYNHFVDGIPGAKGDYAADSSDMNSWLNQKGMDPVEVGDEGYRYFNYDVYVTGPVVIYNKIMAIKKDAANPDPDYASGNYGIAVDLSTGQAEYSPVNYP